ncbi:MAG TPA: glycoside hydrolase family 20 zincin-like fold domain-containing protein [Eudoraea sp.]|nr:glycoside hydrolase family 20 zincin-like fold domain-containing protein [Eudoraea sp.]
MKFYRITSVVFLYVSFLACEPVQERLGDFKLLPQAQQFNITGVSSLSHDDVLLYHISEEVKSEIPPAIFDSLKATEKRGEAQVVLTLDTVLDTRAEGYILSISENKIAIRGRDRAGLFYGMMTLKQLLEDAREQGVHLPLCSIRDYPLLAYRAVHLDVKHHREKKEYYYAIIDKLARYKVNAIIVELEDKIKYERQPLVASADALSIAEWEQLSKYARDRNIEISPLVQGLGHASFILKHDHYKPLRDNPNSDWAFNPLDPETYTVQFDLYRDAMAATPYGRYLHVGGDEVHTTGRGSGKSPLELQLIWLNKVCAFAEANGRIPIFWDDMPLKHAEVYTAMFQPELSKEEVEQIWAENEHKLADFLDLFPKNCIYMRWNYASPQALGNSKAMDWFQKHGMQVMGATAGQRRWVLMPQDGGNLNNIKSFAKSSVEHNLKGLLLTLWDDDSPHFELYWRGILGFAEYTWAGEKRSREALLTAYRHREFSHTLAGEEFSFVDQLEEAVAFWKNALLEGTDRNHLRKSKSAESDGILVFPDPERKGKWSTDHAPRLEKVERILKISDSVASKIRAMHSLATRNTYTLEVYQQVHRMSRIAPKALLALQAFDIAQNEEQTLEAMRTISRLPSEFEQIRAQLEKVYGETRILEKPDDYILDQDHHAHLANQANSFDWQFQAELLFLDKIKREFLDHSANK